MAPASRRDARFCAAEADSGTPPGCDFLPRLTGGRWLCLKVDKPERFSWSGWNGQLGRSRRQLAAESGAQRSSTIQCARRAHGCRASRPFPPELNYMGSDKPDQCRRKGIQPRMNTDGHGWNRGFWRSKNVHQTMAWLRGPISDLAQLHPCESVSIRGFFCIVPDKANATKIANVDQL